MGEAEDVIRERERPERERRARERREWLDRQLRSARETPPTPPLTPEQHREQQLVEMRALITRALAALAARHYAGGQLLPVLYADELAAWEVASLTSEKECPTYGEGGGKYTFETTNYFLLSTGEIARQRERGDGQDRVRRTAAVGAVIIVPQEKLPVESVDQICHGLLRRIAGT